MIRSRTVKFSTNATLNGEPVHENGLAPNGTALPGMGLPGEELPGRELTDRTLTGAGSAPVGRSLNGAPLSADTGGRARGLGRAATPPGRGLRGTDEAADDAAGGYRALEVLKQGLPMVQKLLPLLEGNFLAAISNLLTPRPQSPQKVDLAPIENQLTEMQLLQHDVRGKIVEHQTAMRRVEDQLEMVKEATDRNTMEQQELMEDLRAMGNKVNLFAAMLLGLLVLSLALNFLLFMHIKQVLP
jgi:hypothetical protein